MIRLIIFVAIGLIQSNIDIVNCNGYSISNGNKVPLGILSDQNVNNLTERIIKYLNDHENGSKLSLNIETISSSYETNQITKSVCNLMSNGNLALIGTSKSPSVSNYIKSYLKPFQMPYISLNSPTSQSFKSIRNSNIEELNMFPDFLPMLISLIKYYRTYKHVHYVYNHDEGLDRFERLLEQQTKDADYLIRYFNYKLNNNDISNSIKTIQQQLSKVNTDYIMFIDLDTSQNYEKFLDEIKNMGLNFKTQNNQYILVNLAYNQIDLSKYSTTNDLKLTQFSLIDHNNLKTLSLLVDNFSSSKDIKLSFKETLLIDSIILFNSKISRWLGFDNHNLFGVDQVSLKGGSIYNNNIKGIECEKYDQYSYLGNFVYEKLIKNTDHFHGLSGGIHFDYTGKRIDYSIEIHVINRNMAQSKIGHWSSKNGLEITNSKISNSNSQKNRKLTIVSILDQPFLIEKSKNQYEGFSVDLANELSKLLNFSYEIRVVKDGRFGSMDSNGEWNGIMGEIVRREADIAIAPLTITSKREKYVDFSVSFIEFGLSIVSYQSYGFYKKVSSLFEWNPFQFELIIYTLIGLISIIVTFYIVNRVSLKGFKTNSESRQRQLENSSNHHDYFTLYNSAWYFICAFLQEGIYKTPKSVSGRVVVFVSWLFTLTLIILFLANLTAMRTNDKIPQTNSFGSLDELANQTLIQYGVVSGGSTEEFFRTSQIDLYEKMWSVIKNNNIKNMSEGFEKVRKSGGKFAFIVESSIADFVIRKKPCDLVKIGNNFGGSKGYAIATPIGSELRTELNEAINSLKDDGTLEILKQKWWIKIDECPVLDLKEDSLQFDEIKLPYLIGLFLFVFIGLVFSFLTLIIELIHQSNIDAKLNKTSFFNAFKSQFDADRRNNQNSQINGLRRRDEEDKLTS